MGKFRRIDLSKAVPQSGPLRFLYADISANTQVPFATVYYASDGRKERYGLRLDLDKRAFLDHFDDEEKQHALIGSASAILSAVTARFSEAEQVS